MREAKKAKKEVKWRAGTDPDQMIGRAGALATQRKRRLFCAACCRRIYALLDEEGRQALEAAERYAEEGISQEEAAAAKESYFGRRSEPPAVVAVLAARAAGWGGAAATAARAIATRDAQNDSAFPLERVFQCHLLRDIFGPLPFRTVAIAADWLTPTVLQIAQAAYEHRQLPGGELDAPRLAILSDALEDAGCDNAELLGHLRGSGPHVRGCWALDLVLGKE
jgi:hypothetical protein